MERRKPSSFRSGKSREDDTSDSLKKAKNQEQSNDDLNYNEKKLLRPNNDNNNINKNGREYTIDSNKQSILRIDIIDDANKSHKSQIGGDNSKAHTITMEGSQLPSGRTSDLIPIDNYFEENHLKIPTGTIYAHTQSGSIQAILGLFIVCDAVPEQIELLGALCALTEHSDVNQLEVAFTNSIHTILQLLENDDSYTQEVAVLALANLSSSSQCHEYILRSPVWKALSGLLITGSEISRARAVTTLARLPPPDTESIQILKSTPVISSLMEIFLLEVSVEETGGSSGKKSQKYMTHYVVILLSYVTASDSVKDVIMKSHPKILRFFLSILNETPVQSNVIECVIQVLNHFSQREIHHDNLIETNMISEFLKKIRGPCSTDVTNRLIAETFSNLSMHDRVCDIIYDHDKGVSALVAWLGDSSQEVRYASICIIYNTLAKDYRRDVFLSEGVLPKIFTSIARFEIPAKEIAVKTIMRLIRTRDDNRSLDLTLLRTMPKREQHTDGDNARAGLPVRNFSDIEVIDEVNAWLAADNPSLRSGASRILGKLYREGGEVPPQDAVRCRVLKESILLLIPVFGISGGGGGGGVERDAALRAMVELTRFANNSRMAHSEGVLQHLVPFLANLAVSENSSLIPHVIRIIHNIVQIMDPSTEDGVDCKTVLLPTIPSLVTLILSPKSTNLTIECLTGILRFLSTWRESLYPIGEAGGIDPLDSLLSVGTEKMKYNSIHILARMTEVEAYRTVLASLETIPKVVRLLSCGWIPAQKDCCTVLQRITYNESLREQMVSSGVIPSALALIAQDNIDLRHRAVALFPIILSKDVSARNTLIAGKGHRILIQILNDDDMLAAEAAVRSLWDLTLSPQLNEELVAEGIVPQIVRLLSKDSSLVTFTALESAAATLANLAACSDSNRTTIVESGALPPLIKLLRESTPPIQEKCAACLKQLSTVDQAKEMMIAMDAILPLVVLLKQGSQYAVDRAAGTLENLSVIESSRILMKASDILPTLFQLVEGRNPLISPERILVILKNLSTDTELDYDDEEISCGTEVCDEIVENIGFPKLLGFLSTGSESTVDNAAGIICNILSDESYFDEILDIDVLKQLISIIRKKRSVSDLSHESSVQTSTEVLEVNTESRSEKLLLQSFLPSTSATEYVLQAIWVIITNGFPIMNLRKAGLISGILYIFQNGSEIAKVKACLIIGEISLRDNTIFSNDLFTALTELLRSGDSSTIVIESSIDALRALSVDNYSEMIFHREDTIDILLLLVTLRDGLVTEAVMGILCNLAMKPNNSAVAPHIGNVMNAELISILLTTMSDTEVTNRVCMSEAIYLLSTHVQSQDIILAANGASTLLTCLRSSEDEVIENTINALCNLIRQPVHDRAAMAPRVTSEMDDSVKGALNVSNGGGAGLSSPMSRSSRGTNGNGIEEIVLVLQDSSEHVKENAMLLLLKICMQDRYAVETIISLELKPLVVILDSLEGSSSPATKIYATGILCKVAGRTKGRISIAKIENSLERIAEILKSGNQEARENAIVALHTFARDQVYRNRIISVDNILSVLIELLSHNEWPLLQSTSAALIYQLSRQGPKDKIGEAGALTPLVTLFRDGKGDAKENAKMALRKLAQLSMNREELKALGVTREVIDYKGMFW